MSSREDIRRRIIGDSPALNGVLDRVALLARFPKKVFVIIIGEPGTGKELVAQLIHDLTVPEGPFIAENCAAVPEGLAESHFFGHETGSFTGADKEKKGAFERAHKGTLFLDEIQALPLELQSKLNRALAELQIQRVGGSTVYKLDLRIITATNCNLEEMVKQKLFKEDFFQRINVFPIVVPSLRDRPEDILPLANHFLKQIAPEKKLGLSATDFLQHNICPGNIRVLNNLITAAAVMSGDNIMVEISHIKPVLTWKLPGYEVLERSVDSRRVIQAVEEGETLPREHPFAMEEQQSIEKPPTETEPTEATAEISSIDNHREKRRRSCVVSPVSMSIRKKKILGLIATHSPISTSDLRMAIGASKSTIKRDLDALVKAGDIRRIGQGRNSCYVLTEPIVPKGENSKRTLADENRTADSMVGPSVETNRDLAPSPKRILNEFKDRKKKDLYTTILHSAVEPKTIKELMAIVGRKNRSKFRDACIKPLIDAGLLEMTSINNRRNSKQKYIISEKGREGLTKKGALGG